MAHHISPRGSARENHGLTWPTMERLHRETRPQHERVERVVPLLAPGLTLERYVGYLRALLGYWGPMEERIDRHHGWVIDGFDARDRRKAALLEADLLAVAPRAAANPAPPAEHRHCEALPGVSTVARALGALYVLEGSTLGGLVLARHVAERLGVGAREGASFLAGYGDATQHRFRLFKDAMEASVSRGAAVDEVVSTAAETFATLEAWLAEVRP